MAGQGKFWRFERQPCLTTQRKKNVAVGMTISARLISCVHSLFPFLNYSKVVIRCDGEQDTS